MFSKIDNSNNKNNKNNKNINNKKKFSLAAKCSELTHNVVKTTRRNNTVTATKNIEVTEVANKDLDFALGTACKEKDIYVYFMQAYPHQQDFSEPVNEKIKESSDLIPPRILQSVHGYFSCRDDHPTRINLSASWDKRTVGTWAV